MTTTGPGLTWHPTVPAQGHGVRVAQSGRSGPSLAPFSVPRAKIELAVMIFP